MEILLHKKRIDKPQKKRQHLPHEMRTNLSVTLCQINKVKWIETHCTHRMHMTFFSSVRCSYCFYTLNAKWLQWDVNLYFNLFWPKMPYATWCIPTIIHRQNRIISVDWGTRIEQKQLLIKNCYSSPKDISRRMNKFFFCLTKFTNN